MRFLADPNAAEVKLIKSNEVIGNVAKRKQLLCS